jgi:hypothetical protein
LSISHYELFGLRSLSAKAARLEEEVENARGGIHYARAVGKLAPVDEGVATE